MLTRFVRQEGFVGWRRVDRRLPVIVITMTEAANRNVGCLRNSNRVEQIRFNRVEVEDETIYVEEGHTLVEDDLVGSGNQFEAYHRARAVLQQIAQEAGGEVEVLMLVERRLRQAFIADDDNEIPKQLGDGKK